MEIPAFERDRLLFEAEDAQVLGISVDSTATNAAWAEALGVEHMPLLSDFWPHGEIAQDYGVLRPQGYTERAIFVVDKEGVVRYAHVYDIAEQPENETILEVLRGLD